jgi:cell division protein ZapA
MPELIVKIGGRDFAVACQEGEEPYLNAAAALLDTEATALSGQTGRLPEARMLLMAGLMLADKAGGMEEQLRNAEARLGAKEAELESLRNAPPPEPNKVEVSVIPDSLVDSMAEIAARAESLASEAEEKANALSGG